MIKAPSPSTDDLAAASALSPSQAVSTRNRRQISDLAKIGREGKLGDQVDSLSTRSPLKAQPNTGWAKRVFRTRIRPAPTDWVSPIPLSQQRINSLSSTTSLHWVNSMNSNNTVTFRKLFLARFASVSHRSRDNGFSAHSTTVQNCGGWIISPRCR